MFKKILLGITVLSLVSISSFAGVNNDNSLSGMMNVDNLINSSKVQANQLALKSTSLYSTSSKEAAGGGEFWVEWGGDRHTSCYDHSSKTHSSAAENGNGYIERSGWISAGQTARATIKSTLFGNKAYWNTLD